MTTLITRSHDKNDLTVDIALTALEGEELRTALEGYLAELSAEIAGTDAYDFREALKEKRASAG